MELNTKAFQDAANTILFAVDLSKNTANLELVAEDNILKLRVANNEYFVSVKFEIDTSETFRAVVSAPLFLNLISGLTTETFSLKVADNTIVVRAGKSNYKLAMIYDNGSLMSLNEIKINNVAIDMVVPNDILKSIVNVNSKELLKAKDKNIQELRKMYYIDESGCFTCTVGACLNEFTLEKPIRLLLRDHIVKLFKLFKNDVKLSYGYDTALNGGVQTKVAFESDNIYIAAIVSNDEILFNKILGPYNASKAFMNETYANHLVVSVNALLAAISRLTLFNKNSIEKANTSYIPVTMEIGQNEFSITDSFGNTEVIEIENGSYTDKIGYRFLINLNDLKLSIDTYKNEFVTINCGTDKAVVVRHNNISHLLAQGVAN